MIVHAFYNLDAVGDVLLCRFANGQTSDIKKTGDVCFLFDQHQNAVGLNVFQASKYFGGLEIGQVTITDKIVDVLNELVDGQFDVVIEKDSKERLIVGQVVEIENHPDSDHLHICKVDLGNEVTQIVCGAPNVALDQKVVVATIGTMMPSGLLIVPSTLRKVESNGMLCSARELLLPNAPDVRGILVLEDRYQVGESFIKQFKEGK